jgi:alpha-beta hydrolase superfamily lysophospholipase
MRTADSIVSRADHLKFVLTGKAKSPLHARMHVCVAIFRSFVLYSLCRFVCWLLYIWGLTTPQLHAQLAVTLTRLFTALATVYVSHVYLYDPPRAKRLLFAEELKQRSVLDFPFIVFHDTQDEIVSAEGTALLMECVGQPQANPTASSSNVSKTSIDNKDSKATTDVVHRIRSRTKELQRVLWIPNGLHDLYATSTAILLNNSLSFIDDVLRQRKASKQ